MKRTNIYKLFMAVKLFLGIVWRPVTGDRDDTYFQAWRKYRLDVKTAWTVSAGIWFDRFLN